MLVKDYMIWHPAMVDPNTSIVEAQRAMGLNNVRHLPVVGDGKRLMGLVSRQRLLVDPRRLASLDVWDIARTLSGLTVKDIMVKAKDVVTTSQDTTIEEAASLMVERKIGCLPVVDGPPPGIVIGLITETDLLAHLAEMMGSRRPGIRATVRMQDRRGELARLVNVINSQGWGIMNLGGARAPKVPEMWDAVVKIREVSRDAVYAALSQIEGQELVDIREC